MFHKVQGQGSSGNVEETTECLIVHPLYQCSELQGAVKASGQHRVANELSFSL